MRLFRFFLFPFAILYLGVTSFRNFLFNIGLFKEQSYAVPSLGIGNLSVGGTGKSVAINYFIEQFKDQYPITVLSRGFGRLSKGFQLADKNSTADSIGDEPMMFLKSNPGIRIGVANRRREGMERLLNHHSHQKDSVFLWDDCFQHRWVKPSVMLLLTTFDQPYVYDYLLPVGRLRELSEGARRADIILVTKCPRDITEKAKNAIKSRIQLLSHQSLFFTGIKYAENVYNNNRMLPVSMLEKVPFILVTGIADPSLLVEHLKRKFLQFEHLKYGDHHIFSTRDIEQIRQKSNGCMVLTTQKDYVRLADKFKSELLFFLPIEMDILDDRKEELNALVKAKMGIA